MRSGRFSDTTLVSAMLGLVVLAAVGIFGGQWVLTRESKSLSERALDRQPAVLVESATEFNANQAPGECPAGSVIATAIGIDDGSVRWQQDLPGISAYGNVLTVLSDGSGGFVALHVDASIDELPPSVMAVDVATGELRWQRYMEAQWIDRFAVSETELLLLMSEPAVDDGFDAPDRAVSLNAHGDLDHWFLGDPQESHSEQVGAGFQFADAQGSYSTMVESDGTDLGTGATAQAVVDQSLSFGPLVIFDAAAGSSTITKDVPYDRDFNHLGASSSIGAELQVNDNHVLAVIGSEFGPNTRVVLFDRDSGDVAWTLDHLRAAALAGDVVVYDKRNEEPIEAESTRDIHVVSTADPEIEEWSTALAVNEGGGNGFLGVAGDGLVFAVHNDEIGLEFLTISGPSDVPDLLEAAGGYGSAAHPWSFHIDDDVKAAATADGIVMQRQGQDPLLVPMDLAPNQILRVDDVLLVNQWSCDFG